MGGTGAGAPVGRRVQVKVPEQYRPVSDEVWEELEEYLFLGFLMSPALIFDRTFVFKTLNHQELRYLNHLRPRGKSPPEMKAAFRPAFIAHSLYLVDGENALHGRMDHLRRLTKIVSNLDPAVQEKIVEELGALNQRVARLSPLVDVYVYENRSRFRWMHLSGSGHAIHSTSSTGVSGTQDLGLNYCQQTWVAVNRLTDIHDQLDRDWHNAKFIGSCMSSKGVRSVDERDRARREREKSEREDAKIKVLHDYLNRQAGGPSADARDSAQLPDGRIAKVEKKFQALTVDELADQLSAALSGEKDHHDIVVERKLEEIRRIREDNADMGRRVYTRSFSASVAGEGSTSIPISGASRVLGGKAEAEAQLARMRKLQAEFIAKRGRQVQGDLQSSDRDETGESS